MGSSTSSTSRSSAPERLAQQTQHQHQQRQQSQTQQQQEVPRPSLPVGAEGRLVRQILCEVIPGLWLGSRDAGCQLGLLRSMGITACVNCTDEAHLHPTHLKYYHVEVVDSPSVDIVQYVANGVFPWVGKQLASDSRSAVLVYCHRGVSRSVTIILALLLHLRPTWTLLQCWHHVKRVRPSMRPNPGFLAQLVAYERSLRGTSSVRVSKKAKGLVAWTGSADPTPSLESTRVV